MGFTYHIGIRQFVLEDAPVLNGNAIEDAIIGIQAHFKLPEFYARELFYPDEQTCGGTSDTIFACQWSEQTGQQNLRQLRASLAEQAEMIMSESWSEPYQIELPGAADILVPNLPRIDKSPLMNNLKHAYQLPQYPVCPHIKTFGKEEITMGSLSAVVEVAEIQLAEGVFKGEEKDGIERVLEKLKIAQQHSLFVSFRY